MSSFESPLVDNFKLTDPITLPQDGPSFSPTMDEAEVDRLVAEFQNGSKLSMMIDMSSWSVGGSNEDFYFAIAPD